NPRLDYAGYELIPRLDLSKLKTDVFYPHWYLEAYPDVRNYFGVGNIEGAIDHYRASGINEGRSPNPFFDPSYYKAIYGDLANHDNGRLLDHWINNGFHEGRQGSKWFDMG